MVKEFCVDYTSHASYDYRNGEDCTVKVKTGDEILVKEVPCYDVDSYIKPLKVAIKETATIFGINPFINSYWKFYDFFNRFISRKRTFINVFFI
jgi:hypothetical protein